MFAKLMKYDFRSYFKSLLPIWGAILFLSILNGFTLSRGGLPEVEGFNAFFTFVLPLMLYVTSFFVMAVTTLVLVIQRFYGGLLGSEGYLMFTLPVSRSQLIGSKLLVSVVIQLLSFVVVFLSIFILGALLGRGSFLNPIPELFSKLGEIFREYPNESWTVVLIGFELFVLMVVGMAGTTLHLYAAMSLGHLSKKQRVAMSVLAWVGLNAVLSSLGGRLLSVFFKNGFPDWLHTDSIKGVPPLLLIPILSALLLDAVYWAVSEWVLKRKLNLE